MTAKPLPASVTGGILVALLLFGAVSSFAGGVLGVFLDGAGVPLEYLAGTPFTTYLVPGLVLGIVVGGTQLVGAIALIRKRQTALLLSAVAGFGMLAWIFVEIAMIVEYSPLQTAYFVLGIGELMAVLALLGISPRVAAAWRPVEKI